MAAGGSAAGIVSAEALALSEGMVRMMFLAKLKMGAAALAALATLGALAAAPLLARRAPDGEPAGGPAARPSPAVRPAVARPGVKPGQAITLKPEALERWGKAEAVVYAKLTFVPAGPVAQSFPPIYNHTLQLVMERPIRGLFKKGEIITGRHAIKQKDEPTFPLNKDCLVALKRARNAWSVVAIEEATAAEVAQAELACSLPLGWAAVKGRLLSPWAALGTKAWPADARGQGPFVCAQTGRPALLAGAGVELTVEAVPPKVALKYGNPDGDGEYRVSVRNVTDKAITVPALLAAGDKILWEESLAILCQGKVYPVPGAQGVKEAPRPVTLQPGESVSTAVNALKLQGPTWPRGGYRIEFQFALGEQSVTKSFYYLSRHHDRVREQLLSKKSGDPQK